MIKKITWKAPTLALIILVLAAAIPAQAKGMHQAMKEMAADIKTKHQAAGRSDTAPPGKPLGSSKTVHFTLPMKKGQGQNSVDQYCMGYTLKCVAKVKNPDNTYSGKVSTSEGSKVDFKDKKNGDPLDLTLKTSFWGATTFSLIMWAKDDPFPELAEVEMTCSY